MDKHKRQGEIKQGHKNKPTKSQMVDFTSFFVKHFAAYFVEKQVERSKVSLNLSIFLIIIKLILKNMKLKLFFNI